MALVVREVEAALTCGRVRTMPARMAGEDRLAARAMLALRPVALGQPRGLCDEGAKACRIQSDLDRAIEPIHKRGDLTPRLESAIRPLKDRDEASVLVEFDASKPNCLRDRCASFINAEAATRLTGRIGRSIVRPFQPNRMDGRSGLLIATPGVAVDPIHGSWLRGRAVGSSSGS